ncbi:UNVERIFIED_CONTAM: hypothetical protein Sradi_4013300 [Sesamum radiatum]|uniref:Uncharacterized protein n=1 Tax=Sesamum radiatum TaxID=300843 RepID=A0AAW2PIX3_SESRA
MQKFPGSSSSQFAGLLEVAACKAPASIMQRPRDYSNSNLQRLHDHAIARACCKQRARCDHAITQACCSQVIRDQQASQ